MWSRYSSKVIIPFFKNKNKLAWLAEVNMLYRSASILGVALGHVFSRQKSMAQSVSCRLSGESGHREVQKASS